ncbi:MAG: hypothetical protein R6W99_08775 [Clostridia bacterium]
MKKILRVALLTLLIVAQIISPAYSSRGGNVYLPEADILYELGLFKGSDIGYELEREPMRVEAAAMLIRLLGKEDEVLSGEYSHPFTDVPEWADKYIGYMFSNGLTKGISHNLFGSEDLIDAKSYATFLLRSLGYSDANGDFTWEKALEKAHTVGLINELSYETLANVVFRRGEMVALSYNALNTLVKDESCTLAAVLVEKGALNKEKALSTGISFSFDRIYDLLPYLVDGEYLPYIKGLDESTGIIKLRNCGIYDVKIKYEYDDYAIKGTVIFQNFFPYYIADSSIEIELTVSLGPDPLYHEELISICSKKGWPEEVWPFVIAGGKYIINNTILTKTEVLNRISENINEIKILSLDESAGYMFMGRYYDDAGLMEISAFGLEEEIIIHEMMHAISYDPASGKSGLSPDGKEFDKALEGYTSYITDRKYFIYNEGNTKYTLGDTVINTTSDMHYCNNPMYDGYLEVFSPLFQVAGSELVEKMYFSSLTDYKELVMDFDTAYGIGRWDGLMSLAQEAMTHIHNPTESDFANIAGKFTDYYDGILECLEIDYSNNKEDAEKLSMYFDKLSSIKGSIPLDFNNYREKLRDMEVKTAMTLMEYGIDAKVASKGFWILPEFYGLPSGVVYSRIINIGAYSTGMTYSSGNSGMQKRAVESIKFRTSDIGTYTSLKPGDEIPLGGEYILIIPKEQSALADKGYYVQRNLLDDFKNIRFSFSNPDEFLIKKILGSDGINVEYEFIEAGQKGDVLDGRLIAQYPPAGSALLPGESTVVLTFIKGK